LHSRPLFNGPTFGNPSVETDNFSSNFLALSVSPLVHLCVSDQWLQAFIIDCRQIQLFLSFWSKLTYEANISCPVRTSEQFYPSNFNPIFESKINI